MGSLLTSFDLHLPSSCFNTPHRPVARSGDALLGIPYGAVAITPLWVVGESGDRYFSDATKV